MSTALFTPQLEDDPFIADVFQDIMQRAPVGYMESSVRYAIDDLYFVAGIPKELHKTHTLRFYYAEQ